MHLHLHRSAVLSGVHCGCDSLVGHNHLQETLPTGVQTPGCLPLKNLSDEKWKGFKKLKAAPETTMIYLVHF